MSKSPFRAKSGKRGSPKTRSVEICITEAMAGAIEKVIEQNPIEFRNKSDFHRTALKNELQRRGLL